MSTEYRRGIPSTAHVEAATRLGLLWEDDDVGTMKARWRLEAHADGIRGDYATSNTNYTNWDSGPLVRAPVRNQEYRPIRSDGTPVDWEVLDQEVARVGQPDCEECAGTGRVDSPTHEGSIACSLCSGTGTLRRPATVTPTTPTTQPQGFRADLWRYIALHLAQGHGCRLADVIRLDWRGFHVENPFFTAEVNWPIGLNSTDILARWTVYQELKPLYDLVDGAQGEAAMPRDVEAEWSVRSGGSAGASGNWRLCRDGEGLYAQGAYVRWHPSEGDYGTPLRNFAAVLDAVAERRVVERMRGQTQAPTVTSAQPEPRRFADVRPDRHGWRWWHLFGSDCGARGTLIEVSPVHGWRVKDDPDADWHLRGHYNSAVDGIRTVIPTDEQGNPVSWESIGPTDPTEIRLTSAPGAPDRHGTRGAAPEGPPPRPGQFSNDLTASAPITAESFARVLQQMDRSAMVAATRFAETPQTRALVEAQRAREEAETRARVLQQVRNGVEQELSDNRVIIGVDTLKQQPLPRFTADELDDVDHSKTTKLDEVTLRRGKLPTVEQIAKYREVQTRRTGGAVADALKESRIDCEVAQYVLERWAGGLGDANVLAVIEEVRFLDCAVDVDKRAAWFIGLMCNRLDTSEKPSPTVQRERQEAEERRQRLAELRQRLAAERTAQPTEEAPTTTSRFDLIEPDPQADPAASIRAWEARQAAAKAQPMAAPTRITKPAAVPRRPAIEVVDAEVDGLSRSEAFAALFGRALNGGC